MIFKLMWVVFFFFFFSFYDKFDFIRGENTIASAELTNSSVPDTSLPACGQLKFYISHGVVAVCLSRQRALQLQTLSARSLIRRMAQERHAITMSFTTTAQTPPSTAWSKTIADLLLVTGTATVSVTEKGNQNYLILFVP